MTLAINDTHDASRRSWLDPAYAAASDFPIQNLPLGRFSGTSTEPRRLGAAIGERIVDLRQASLVVSHEPGQW